MQSAVLRIVSIAEEYSRMCLMETVEARLPSNMYLVTKLWSRAAQDVDVTWEKQCQAWAEWFGVRVAAATEYKRLEPFISLRNTIAHGLGHLTRRQIGRDGGRALLESYRRAGIPFSGYQVLVNESCVERNALAAVDYIAWLDRSVTSLPA
jgi:hypothetical protein